MKTILILTAALSLCSCAKLGITPGQGLALAGQTLDAYQRQRASNVTAAKVAVNVQPAEISNFKSEISDSQRQGRLASLFYAVKLLWP
jgi:hypothetical protein